MKSRTSVCLQGCIKLRPARACSADFQSAVSQVSNLPPLEHTSGLGVATPCRLGSRRLAHSLPLARPFGPCPRFTLARNSRPEHGPALLLGALVLCASLHQAGAQNAYLDHRLVSDLPGADLTDTNLLNPWGIAFSPTGAFWISDNHAGVSTLYNSSGAPQALVVNIPPPAGGAPPAAPTGMIYNTNTAAFFVAPNAAARFIFSTEDGTIAAWNSGTNAVLKVTNSTAGAVYASPPSHDPISGRRGIHGERAERVCVLRATGA
jgi:hypothetical protein